MINSDEQEFSSPQCRRFSELIEQKWADERDWIAEEAAFYEQHKATCAECRDFDELLGVMSDPQDDLPDTSVTDLSIRRVVDQKFKNTRKRRFFAAAAAVAVAAGIAAVIAFTVRTPSADPQPGFALTKGGVILSGRSLDIGEHFSFSKNSVEIPTDTLIEIPDTLYIAMEEDAQLGAVDQTEDTVHIRLNEGRIAVHLVPGGKLHVEVETEEGLVTVKGTVFIVEARKNVNTVSVVRGRVQVTPKRAATQARALDAGWAFSFGERKSSPRASMKEDHLLKLLGIPDPLPEPVKTEEPPKTDHSPEAVESIIPAKPPSVPPPETLLQAALECRAAKNWRCAVDNYGKLVDRYPGLPDAATAMIPIAQILLDNLNRPREALQYFRRYQKRRPKGGLGQEAVYGECRALEQLGRTKAEKACLERYLEKYPNTVYTQMAKSRLLGIIVKD